MPGCLQGKATLSNIVWTAQNNDPDARIIDQRSQPIQLCLPADQADTYSGEFLVQMSLMGLLPRLE